jgi:hypothetical protein
VIGLFGAAPIAAQSKELVCRSNNNNYRFCRADTDNRVRLERALKGYCRLNSTWGYNNRGIWVDRGCHGRFLYGRSYTGKKPVSVYINPNRYENQRRFSNSGMAFNFGYSTGRSDAQRGQRRNPGAHDNEYDSRWRNDFRRGYQAGFNSVTGNANNSQNINRNAYNRGFSRGQQDARNNLSNDFRRYNREFNRSTRNDFRSGYREGYRRNSFNYNPGNSTSRVPNWLIGTWTNQTRTAEITFYSSGSARLVNKSRGRVTNTVIGYFRNNVLSFPSAGTSYRIDKRGRTFRSTDIYNSRNNAIYYRIY